MSTKILVADFETTVYDGQTSTEVWASAVVELGSEDVKVFHSIGETYGYFLSFKQNLIVYYHNLKFDGSFWISYLMYDLGYSIAGVSTKEDLTDFRFLPRREMQNKSYSYTISDKGMWYAITIKDRGHYIELRDSLKLLPFSVKAIGKAFKTKHQKLEMEYKGLRYANCKISDDELQYIKNDVLVMNEALKITFDQGHDKLTIGACCLDEFKKGYDVEDYETMFPNLYEIELDETAYGSSNAGAYIRKSYHGGWCYVVKGKECKVYHNGNTADVNSLYPSMMHSMSGNKYPVGKPKFWKGNYIPDELKKDKFVYFIRVKTRFYIKPNKLPCIQCKGTFVYPARQWLENSDVKYYDKAGNVKTSTKYRDLNGDIVEARPTLTLTMMDFELIKEQYELVDFEILDGCYFYSMTGIFDEYINKYMEIKLKATGAIRTLAKLFLNNLYGKLAMSTDNSFKICVKQDDGSFGFKDVYSNDKKPGYIPCGSYITSYARNFTIRAAQMNYYGADKAGFIYADTDSIHCDLPADEIKGITVHDSNFCCWKLEGQWDEAYFTRQKTYIEHIVGEDLKPVKQPYYSIKCAGMGNRPKELLEYSLCGSVPIYEEKDGEIKWCKYTDDEKDFLGTMRTYDDFRIGLRVPGNLKPRRIKGGTILEEQYYQMNPANDKIFKNRTDSELSEYIADIRSKYNVDK